MSDEYGGIANWREQQTPEIKLDPASEAALDEALRDYLERGGQGTDLFGTWAALLEQGQDSVPSELQQDLQQTIEANSSDPVFIDSLADGFSDMTQPADFSVPVPPNDGFGLPAGTLDGLSDVSPSPDPDPLPADVPSELQQDLRQTIEDNSDDPVFVNSLADGLPPVALNGLPDMPQPPDPEPLPPNEVFDIPPGTLDSLPDMPQPPDPEPLPPNKVFDIPPGTLDSLPDMPQPPDPEPLPPVNTPDPGPPPAAVGPPG